MPSIPEAFHDLLHQQVATFGTVGRNGRPQLSVVWFLADGDTVALSLSSARKKTENLQANPDCSLLVLDPANPFRYLELRGRARLSEDENYEFAKKVGEKYNADLRQYDDPGDTRYKVTIEADRVRAVDMSA